MRTAIALCAAVAILVVVGCGDESVTGPEGALQTFDPVSDFTVDPDGGSCPDVYWETVETLDNGVTVTWTSAFGGFDYGLGSGYGAAAMWSVDLGSATFVSFAPRKKGKNTWTPKGKVPVNGVLSAGTAGAGSVPLTVSMSPMHQGNDDVDGDGVDDWIGQIGNGHFWLIIDVDDGAGNVEQVKLGVNFHLEDPDDGSGDRCPTG
jgi:hypothetical protein